MANQNVFRLAGLLLGILALIIGCIIVVLRLLIPCGTGITCPLPSITSLSTVCGLGWTIATLDLLVVVSRLYPRFRATPRGNIRATGCDVVNHARCRPRGASIGTRSSFPELCHQTRIFRIESSSTTRGRWATRRRRSVRVFIHSTITSHMTSTTANTTYNVSGKISLLRAVIFAVPDAAAILTDLIFVVA